MTELIDSDVAIALSLFKRSAQILDAQIIKILHVEQQLQAPLYRRSMELTGAMESFATQQRNSQEFEQRKSQEFAPQRNSQEFEQPVAVAEAGGSDG